MSSIVFNYSTFNGLFPELTATVSASAAQAYFNSATAYVSNQYGGCYTALMSVAQQTQALYLMTAHLAYIASTITEGQTPGVMTAATVDKISVTLEPPPLANQWQYWLQSTPYGQQLLALLQIASVGGGYASTAAPGRIGFNYGGVW
ncbi:MAG: DUF4054 domain-containing protein [Patescibacteria group bacterium]|nr:DUF4054 domain-containing protein [Patescibacteria group bacterium]